MSKKYDAAVKVGEYMLDGEKKGRYLNVGAVMQGDNGLYLILDRTFNPAGVPNPEGRSNVIVSFFEPKEQAPRGNARPAAQRPAPKQVEPDFQDDDIPFNS
jgi:hypothetical protein